MGPLKSPAFLLLVSLSVLGVAAWDQQPAPAATPEPEVKFGRDVMPILGQQCFKCHGPDAAQVAAGLRLD